MIDTSTNKTSNWRQQVRLPINYLKKTKWEPIEYNVQAFNNYPRWKIKKKKEKERERERELWVFHLTKSTHTSNHGISKRVRCKGKEIVSFSHCIWSTSLWHQHTPSPLSLKSHHSYGLGIIYLNVSSKLIFEIEFNPIYFL